MPVRFESLRSLIRKPSSHWFLSDLGMEGGFRTGIDRQAGACFLRETLSSPNVYKFSRIRQSGLDRLQNGKCRLVFVLFARACLIVEVHSAPGTDALAGFGAKHLVGQGKKDLFGNQAIHLDGQPIENFQLEFIRIEFDLLILRKSLLFHQDHVDGLIECPREALEAPVAGNLE